MSETDKETYIEQLEKSKGGKISYRCFSLYYSDTNGNKKEHGVFLYQIGRTLYYEDFMFSRSLLGIELNKKAQEEYVKFESSVDIDSITEIKLVSMKQADKYCDKTVSSIKKAGFFARTFGKTAVMVNTNRNFAMFLDLPYKDFKNSIINAQKEKK